MIADLLNTQITSLDVLEKLPFDAVVISDRRAWQRLPFGDWYAAGSDIDETSAGLLEYGPLLLVWLPPEVTR